MIGLIKTRIAKIVMGVAASLIAIVALLFGFEALVAAGLCETEVIDEIPSPEGQRTAIVFSRDCGATSGFNTQVAVRENGWFAPRIPDSFVSGGGRYHVTVVWHGEDRLAVRFPKDAEVRRKSPVDGVQVEIVSEP